MSVNLNFPTSWIVICEIRDQIRAWKSSKITLLFHFLTLQALVGAPCFSFSIVEYITLVWSQAYRHELLEAYECCMKYKRTGKDAELTQVWKFSIAEFFVSLLSGLKFELWEVINGQSVTTFLWVGSLSGKLWKDPCQFMVFLYSLVIPSLEWRKCICEPTFSNNLHVTPFSWSYCI